MLELVELLLGILEQEAGGVKVSELMLFDLPGPCFGALLLGRVTWEKKNQTKPPQKKAGMFPISALVSNVDLGAKIPLLFRASALLQDRADLCFHTHTDHGLSVNLEQPPGKRYGKLMATRKGRIWLMQPFNGWQ